MNNKGFATIGMMVAVLFVSMAIIGTFFNPILSTTVNMENSRKLTPQYIENMNSLERIYSIFVENPSHVGDIQFEDTERNYNVNEIISEHSTVQKNLLDGETFELRNKTDIRIEFKSESIGFGQSDYDIQIKLNGETIVEDYGLSNNTLVEISNSYLYNTETGITNYGEFEININERNAEVSAEVRYENLDYREIELSNENFTRTIIITDENVSFE